MKCASILAVIAAVSSIAAPVVAQPSPPLPAPGAPPPPLEDIGKTFPPIGGMEKVADNLYLVSGQGGNTAVWVYSNGVLIVDTKFPKNGQKLIELIRTVTDKPVTHIVNTHAHIDHNGSNPEYPAEVEIIAQENTAAAMQKSRLFEIEKNKVGLPDRTFKDHLTLFEGEDAVDVYHFGLAHSSGDAVVIFRSAHVAHVGDMMKKKELPTVDVSLGGSGVQFSASLAKAVTAIKSVDRVIGGHNDSLMAWQDFTRLAELSHLLLTHERAALKAGKTPEQTLAEFNPPKEFSDFDRAGTSFGGVAAVKATFNELAQTGRP